LGFGEWGGGDLVFHFRAYWKGFLEGDTGETLGGGLLRKQEGDLLEETVGMPGAEFTLKKT